MILADERVFLPQESYFKAMANAPIVVAEGEEDLEVDYDSDGYPILPERSKVRYNLPLCYSVVLLSSVIIATQVIDPLPPMDHSAVSHRMLLRYQLHLYPPVCTVVSPFTIPIQ